METALVWTVSYFLGCIPFGVLVARTRRIDLRDHGSGNIGATNAARVLGKKLGLLTLIGDLFKGVLAVFIADNLLDHPMQTAVSGLMAFLGHVFSVFLKFKGGKGVATGLGVFLYLMPAATLCCMAVFAVTLWLTGYVSAGSIVAALFLPVFGIVFNVPAAYISVSVIVALIVLGKHHENIQRILQGTEARFLKK